MTKGLPFRKLRAPEFPAGLPWLNTGGRALTLEDLRGRVVLLDFWTYCCINCLHVLPDLKYLEERFAGEPFVVVGVHAAKFYNEREAENIRQAVLRYGVGHPVVVDSDLKVWRRYGARAWPTLILVDPEGCIAATFSGEGHREVLEQEISRLLEVFGATGKLDHTPLEVTPEGASGPGPGRGELAFPGKVLADEGSGRLYIADTNHHRILVSDLAGCVVDVAGSGEPGLKDGGFDVARFHNPQGLAIHRGDLLVADTDNHALRRLDLARRTVETVAGAEERLNSPWDLWVDGDVCYIAMAGSHQIWAQDCRTGRVGVYAGSGREARVDGGCRSAAFAQPSGLASDGRRLYVADSEVSAIRAVDMGVACRVSTVVGGDLFDFGDRDGVGEEVRLQHPLGVCWHRGFLYLADTYNHKLKRVNPDARTCESWLGTGRPGAADGKSPEFYEPGGLSGAGDRLFVADTNNHRIRVVDLGIGVVSTLVLA